MCHASEHTCCEDSSCLCLIVTELKEPLGFAFLTDMMKQALRGFLTTRSTPDKPHEAKPRLKAGGVAQGFGSVNKCTRMLKNKFGVFQPSRAGKKTRQVCMSCSTLHKLFYLDEPPPRAT